MTLPKPETQGFGYPDPSLINRQQAKSLWIFRPYSKKEATVCTLCTRTCHPLHCNSITASILLTVKNVTKIFSRFPQLTINQKDPQRSDRDRLLFLEMPIFLIREDTIRLWWLMISIALCVIFTILDSFSLDNALFASTGVRKNFKQC